MLPGNPSNQAQRSPGAYLAAECIHSLGGTTPQSIANPGSPFTILTVSTLTFATLRKSSMG